MMHSNESSLVTEYDAACYRVALVNRSGVGMLEIGGKDGLDLLHRISTNDLLRAGKGSVTPTLFVTEKARILDYVHVLNLPTSVLLLISQGNEPVLRAWIEKFTIMEDVTITVRTGEHALLTLVGPYANAAAEKILECPAQPGRVAERTLPFATVTVLWREEFGVSFVDMLARAEFEDELRRFILSRAEDIEVTPMGSLAYETFRIAHGIPNLGAELSETFNPYEVGLRGAISFTKGCYIGQEVIARLDTYQKVQREPWGIVLDGRNPAPLRGAKVMQKGAEIGTVTSVSEGVIRGKRCAIGILKKRSFQSDDPIGVEGQGAVLTGMCMKFPVLL